MTTGGSVDGVPNNRKSVSPFIGRLPVLSLAIGAGAVVGIAAACLLVPIHWDDQSFYLYAAPRLLGGYHLYGADITDTNPPLIAWMTMISAVVARVAHTTLFAAFVFCVTLLIGMIIFWVLRLSRHPPPLFLPWLAVLLVYGTVILPSVNWHGEGGFGALRYDFGQREHIMALLILPYLFAAVRRIQVQRLIASEAVAIGFLAALGFCLKPQYLLIVVGVEGLLLVRTHDPRQLLRPELLALAVGGLAYCLAVWVVTPDYFKNVIPVTAKVYGEFDYQGPAAMLYRPSIYLMALLAALLLRRSGVIAMASLFLIAGVAAFAAYFIQHKGWSDHLLPAQLFLTLALGVTIAGHIIRWREKNTAPPIGIAALVAIGLVVGVIAFGAYDPLRTARSLASEREHQIADINRTTKNFPAGTTFLVLTDEINFQFDIAIDRGFTWASRYPFLLLPEAILQSANEPAAARQTRGYMMISPLFGSGSADFATHYVGNLRADVVDDFRRWHPAIVLVKRCAPEACAFGPNFSIIDWLSAAEGFDGIWSRYHLARQIKDYDLYLADDRSPDR